MERQAEDTWQKNQTPLDMVLDLIVEKGPVTASSKVLGLTTAAVRRHHAPFGLQGDRRNAEPVFRRSVVVGGRHVICRDRTGTFSLMDIPTSASKALRYLGAAR